MIRTHIYIKVSKDMAQRIRMYFYKNYDFIMDKQHQILINFVSIHSTLADTWFFIVRALCIRSLYCARINEADVARRGHAHEWRIENPCHLLFIIQFISKHYMHNLI